MSHNGMLTGLNSWVKDHYGSRRGLVKTYFYRLHYRFGGFRQCRRVDWSAIERLVFVCKGNICRSAYAEQIARSQGLEAISCGLQTIVSVPADEGAIAAAENRGVNLENHRTTPIMYLVLRKTDLLVAMEPWHIKYMAANLVREHHYTLLGLWQQPALPHIQDPYGNTANYFDRCFKTIETSVHGIHEKIKKSAC